MTKNNQLVLAIAIVIVLVGLIWYGASKKQVAPVQGKELKIGVILPLSGPAVKFGDRAKNGIELAKEGILAKYPKLKITLIYEDGQYKPKESLNAYQKLVNLDKINALISAATHVSIPIAKLANEQKIIQMAVFASGQSYSSPNDYSFRVSTLAHSESETISNYAAAANYKKVGVLYLNNEFGADFKNSFRNFAEKAGIQITVEEGYELQTPEFRAHLTKLKIKKPDAVYIIGLAKAIGEILKEAKSLKFSPQFLSMRAAQDEDTLNIAKEAAEGLLYSYIFDTDLNEEAKAFAQKYQNKYNLLPDAYAAEGYEALQILVDTYAKCNFQNNDCVKDTLLSTKNHLSVFGSISFDQNGDISYPAFLKTIKAGKFVKLEE